MFCLPNTHLPIYLDSAKKNCKIKLPNWDLKPNLEYLSWMYMNSLYKPTHRTEYIEYCKLLVKRVKFSPLHINFIFTFF